jgi:hypothetical protein
MQCWHLDDKCKRIVNDGVKELVCHLPPWKMCQRLQLVIYKQLRARHDKTCNNKLIIKTHFKLLLHREGFKQKYRISEGMEENSGLPNM